MANAIILHRRRSEKIEPGSQTFTANGVFIAPYSAVYSLILYGSAHKAGNGGHGGTNDSHLAGGGGGGGGGRSHSNFAVSCQCQLTKGAKIPITINESMVSLGNYASVATGTAAENGSSGGNARLPSRAGYGGSGGAGEGKHTISVPGNYTTAGSDTGTSGDDGGDGSGTREGYGGSGGYFGGGRGGRGAGSFDDNYPDGTDGVASVIGKIEISWGGNE